MSCGPHVDGALPLVQSKHGFDERVARLEGLYGAGSYFADALCKSHQYAQVWPIPTAD